jgi:hypothetical protein
MLELRTQKRKLTSRLIIPVEDELGSDAAKGADVLVGEMAEELVNPMAASWELWEMGAKPGAWKVFMDGA